jgi:hypothetical protein
MPDTDTNPHRHQWTEGMVFLAASCGQVGQVPIEDVIAAHRTASQLAADLEQEILRRNPETEQ